MPSNRDKFIEVPSKQLCNFSKFNFKFKTPICLYAPDQLHNWEKKITNEKDKKSAASIARLLSVIVTVNLTFNCALSWNDLYVSAHYIIHPLSFDLWFVLLTLLSFDYTWNCDSESFTYIEVRARLQLIDVQRTVTSVFCMTYVCTPTVWHALDSLTMCVMSICYALHFMRAWLLGCIENLFSHSLGLALHIKT